MIISRILLASARYYIPCIKFDNKIYTLYYGLKSTFKFKWENFNFDMLNLNI